MKVFVGVVMPYIAPTGVGTFDLCQGRKCVNAGQVTHFGSSTEHVDKPSEPRIDEKNYYIAKTDVTAVMEEQGWSLKKRLVAKMTSSMVGNLPEPVVIFKDLGEGGKVIRRNATLSPNLRGGLFRSGGKQHHPYGNLLDNYSL